MLFAGWPYRGEVAAGPASGGEGYALSPCVKDWVLGDTLWAGGGLSPCVKDCVLGERLLAGERAVKEPLPEAT